MRISSSSYGRCMRGMFEFNADGVFAPFDPRVP